MQIKRDLNRTFPNCAFYAEKEVGQEQMERVLITICKYDPKIGYVQGMNFIVGALLYHCSEEIAFWLFVALVEDHEMRDIYMPGIVQIEDLYRIAWTLQTYTNYRYSNIRKPEPNLQALRIFLISLPVSANTASEWRCLRQSGSSRYLHV